MPVFTKMCNYFKCFVLLFHGNTPLRCEKPIVVNVSDVKHQNMYIEAKDSECIAITFLHFLKGD